MFHIKLFDEKKIENKLPISLRLWPILDGDLDDSVTGVIGGVFLLGGVGFGRLNDKSLFLNV